MNNQAVKKDHGKARLDLVPLEILEPLARVREFAVKKYGMEGIEAWREISNDRLLAALLRHTVAFQKDPDALDEESGLPAIYHVAINAAFLAIKVAEQQGNSEKEEISVEEAAKRAIESLYEEDADEKSKTMKEDFFEKHPTAKKHPDGRPPLCPWLLGYEEKSECNPESDCLACWSRPLTEDTSAADGEVFKNPIRGAVTEMYEEYKEYRDNHRNPVPKKPKRMFWRH